MQIPMFAFGGLLYVMEMMIAVIIVMKQRFYAVIIFYFASFWLLCNMLSDDLSVQKHWWINILTMTLGIKKGNHQVHQPSVIILMVCLILTEPKLKKAGINECLNTAQHEMSSSEKEMCK